MPYYNPNQHRLGAHERAVQRAGYHWVSITRLNPTGTGPTNTGGTYPDIADRLDGHQHHSNNTHLIISGCLTLYPTAVRSRNVRSLVIDAGNNDRNQKEAKIPPGVQYSGVSGPEGAVFVEGHELLSPDTARRFEARGDLVWVDDGMTKSQWFAQQRSMHQGQAVRPIVQGGLRFNGPN